MYFKIDFCQFKFNFTKPDLNTQKMTFLPIPQPRYFVKY